jgi:histone-lysine N-methyltransferase SETMAR
VSFFDHNEVVHYEFIAQGQTTVLFEVDEKATVICSEKRPELWPNKWILHHDNATEDDALRVGDFLANKSIKKMDHPPYSPDLAPCDFLALSKITKCSEETMIC